MERGNKDDTTIEMKSLLEDIRRQNREMLEKRLFELTAAYSVGKEISSISDLERCLRILVNRIADLMSVEIVSLMLMDAEKSALMIKIAKGLDEEIVKEARVQLGDNIAGWVAKTGEPLLIEDISKDPRFVKRSSRYYTDSLLSVPLKVGNRVIGVINVNNKVSKDIFRREDLDILKTVADLAGVAIESAHLHEEVKARDKTRLDFISNVSHELRTPLAVIKEAVCSILDGICGSVNEEQKKSLEMAKQNAERLARLINELLELGKAESKQTPMKRSLFDLSRVIRNILTSLKVLAKDKGISLTAVLPDEKVEIWGDVDKVTQVLTNLIDNAIKYNKPNGKVEIGLEVVVSSVRIYISDTGAGISKEDLGKIFDRFYRVQMCVEGKTPGTGLGLSITRDILAMHGGEISVESEPNKGSKFTIVLPKDLRMETLRGDKSG